MPASHGEGQSRRLHALLRLIGPPCGHRTRLALMRPLPLLLVLPVVDAGATCLLATHALKCDGRSDDTHALQAALTSCAADSEGPGPVPLPVGRTCVSFPVTIPSHGGLLLPHGTVLKAGRSILWPNTSLSVARPFITSVPGAVNLSLTGVGTVDGSGAQWWTGNNKTPRRPLLIELDAAGVLLEGLLLLNPAAWTTSLAGSSYRIVGIKIRSPDYAHAPNTDGLDISAQGVHISGVDIQNGDDSICMKSPAQDVLVENSVVRQGNGLVVGTSSNADFRNITFRNITAIGTAFGCHIKFKDAQVGSVSGVVFEDILIQRPQRYAIGIDQNGQGEHRQSQLGADESDGGSSAEACPHMRALSLLVPQVGMGANVSVNNVTFRNITATVAAGQMGGCFVCNPGRLSCHNIVFDRVHMAVEGSAVGAQCSFRNVYGRGVDVSPRSCDPPRSPAQL